MRTDASTAIEPWLAALHASSERLARIVDGLSDKELSGPSVAGEWTIAQVLSHLGSGAEIGTGILERGLAGDTDAPRPEDLAPIWDRWNALGAVEQRARWREADARHLRLLDSLGGDEHAALRVPYFAGLLDLPTYAGYRLSEQSVHAWDVEVARDPEAAIPMSEAALLWERLDLVATRFRDGATLSRLSPRGILVNHTGGSRPAALMLTSELHLYPCEPAEPTAEVTGGLEAIVRLVYGRNRPARDGVTVTGSVDLEDLRALFPGY